MSFDLIGLLKLVFKLIIVGALAAFVAVLIIIWAMSGYSLG